MGVRAVCNHIRGVRSPALAGLPPVADAAAFLGGPVLRGLCSQQHSVVHRSDYLPNANRSIGLENLARRDRRAVVAVWADLGGRLNHAPQAVSVGYADHGAPDSGTVVAALLASQPRSIVPVLRCLIRNSRRQLVGARAHSSSPRGSALDLPDPAVRL